MKICKKCGETKPYNEFKIDKRNKHGAGSPCRSCYKEYLNKPETKLKNQIRLKKWYQLNRDDISRKNKGNPESLKRYRNYHAKNKEKIDIYNKKYFSNPEVVKKYQEKYREKNKARWIVKDALRSGKLKKPEFCSMCNGSGRIEAHHEDYTQPLNVIWLCTTCHKKQHYKYKE